MKKVKLFKKENGENVLVGIYKNKLAAELASIEYFLRRLFVLP